MFCYSAEGTDIKPNPIYLISLFLLIILFVLPLKAEATVIEDALSIQRYPAIFGNKIVWEDNRQANWNIFIFNLNTRSFDQITTNTADQTNPAIHGNKIVWQDLRNGQWDIYMYNLTTHNENRITTNGSGQFSPAIYGDKIVWEDSRGGDFDIYMYNITTGAETRITSNGSDQTKPAIYGNKIVWQDWRNGNWDIYMYNLTTFTESRVTTITNGSDQTDPAIHGNKVVWTDDRNGSDDIYLNNLTSHVESRITTNNSRDEKRPAIYGNKIVWDDNRSDPWWYTDIYMHNLTAGSESIITNATDNQYYAAIYGNKVVWTDVRNAAVSSADIYMDDIGAPVTSFSAPVQNWNSGAGNWDADATKLARGDFNGDGNADIGALYEYPAQREAKLFIWLSDGAGDFSPPQAWWDSGPGNWDAAGSKLTSGDYNGDGITDLTVFYSYFSQRQAKAWMFNSNGTSFNIPALWWDSGAGNWDGAGSKLVSGDYNGDGKGDLAVLYNYLSQRQAKTWIFSSSGTSFVTPAAWWDSGAGNWDGTGAQLTSGDYNGDNLSDLSVLYNYFSQRQAKAWVFPSNGASFNIPASWWDSGAGNWDSAGSQLTSGDYDGDSLSDLGILYSYSGNLARVFTLTSNLNNFNAAQIWWDSGAGAWDGGATRILSGDFTDADAIDELVGFYGYGGARSGIFLFR